MALTARHCRRRRRQPLLLPSPPPEKAQAMPSRPARPTPPGSRREPRPSRSRIAGCPWQVQTHTSSSGPQRSGVWLHPAMSPLDTGGLTTGTDGRESSGKGQGPCWVSAGTEGGLFPNPGRGPKKKTPESESGEGRGSGPGSCSGKRLGSLRTGGRVQDRCSLRSGCQPSLMRLFGPRSGHRKRHGSGRVPGSCQDEMRSLHGPTFRPVQKTVFPVLGRSTLRPPTSGWSLDHQPPA